MSVSVVFNILFSAHCCLTNVTVRFMILLLPVYHVASPGAMHSLTCVHVQGFVKRAQALLQVMGCSVKRLVPTDRGLVMKLVIGWPAFAYWQTANCSQVVKHMTSQLRTTLQWPPFLFLVVSGNRCTDPACSFLSGVR